MPHFAIKMLEAYTLIVPRQQQQQQNGFVYRLPIHTSGLPQTIRGEENKTSTALLYMQKYTIFQMWREIILATLQIKAVNVNTNLERGPIYFGLNDFNFFFRKNLIFSYWLEIQVLVLNNNSI